MKTVNEIKRICNLGCGTMGFGTAIAFAQHGYEVNMFGRKDASIDRAMGNIRATLAIMKANELLTDEGEIALLKTNSWCHDDRRSRKKTPTLSLNRWLRIWL